MDKIKTLTHSFNIQLAQEIGIEKAIILGHLIFFLDQIQYTEDKNDTHTFTHNDGFTYYWTYMSGSAFEKQYTYMNKKSIERWLRELESSGYIISNSFNKSKYDKTKWYTTNQYRVMVDQNEPQEVQNAPQKVQIESPIPSSISSSISQSIIYAKNEFSQLDDNSIKEENKQQDSMEALGIHADTYAEPQNIPSQTQESSMEGNESNTFSSLKGEASEPEGAGTNGEKKKGSAKKEKKDPNEPQTLEEFITSCKSSSQAHVRVIGEWAEAMQPKNNTRGQWDSYFKRNLRAATTLSPYPIERLQLALDLLLKDKKTDQNPNGYITKYTLETLSKYIDLV